MPCRGRALSAHFQTPGLSSVPRDFRLLPGDRQHLGVGIAEPAELRPGLQEILRTERDLSAGLIDSTPRQHLCLQDQHFRGTFVSGEVPDPRGTVHPGRQKTPPVGLE